MGVVIGAITCGDGTKQRPFCYKSPRKYAIKPQPVPPAHVMFAARRRGLAQRRRQYTCSKSTYYQPKYIRKPARHASRRGYQRAASAGAGPALFTIGELASAFAIEPKEAIGESPV